MPPCFSKQNGGNTALGYFEFVRQGQLTDATCGITPSHVSDLFFCEFTGWMFRAISAIHTVLLSTRDCLSSFFDAILCILLGSADKHVRWITAKWPVTMVTDQQSIWNRTIDELVCEFVGAVGFIADLKCSIRAGTSLGFSSNRTLPWPAIRNSADIDETPKSWFNQQFKEFPAFLQLGLARSIEAMMFHPVIVQKT